MAWLEQEQVALKSLQENIDTSTSSGNLIFHIFGALAEFERNWLKNARRLGYDQPKREAELGEGQQNWTMTKKD